MRDPDKPAGRRAGAAPALAHPSGYVSQRGRIMAVRLLAAGALLLILVSRSLWEQGSFADTSFKAAGTCLVVAAVLGRLWCTLYIGGRKNTLLVTAGPYSISRNPLYFFSMLGAAGIGLLFGSLALAAMLGGGTALALVRASRAEAALLARRFGADYARYARRVPLLWPRLSLYRDAARPSFQPHAIGRALRDALLFLLAPPMAGLVEYGKANGMLPHLVGLF